jgi:cytochrome c peroxidase
LLDKAKSLFKPLPESSALENTALTPERVALGKALFYETRVSSDGRQGCVSCHNPAYYGADSLPLSLGIFGKVLPRNAHTVFNTSLLMAQHYGGNRATVEEQAVKALTSPVAYGNANLPPTAGQQTQGSEVEGGWVDSSNLAHEPEHTALGWAGARHPAHSTCL